ncbi:putative CCR4-NOT transcription complex subunit 4 [Helianthus debilis subsp. tardiflorus]
MKMPAPETHERDLPMAKLEISVVVYVEENKGLTTTSDSESPTSSPTSSRSSCSSGSGGCFSRSITDEGDGDHDDDDNNNNNDNDDCLDDWEAMADALAADDIQKNHNKEYPVHETSAKPEPVTIKTGQVDFRAPVSFRAWRLDDASRPQGVFSLLHHLVLYVMKI